MAQESVVTSMSSGKLLVPAAATGGCISVGNFDGVHLGHASMLRELKAMASSCGVKAVAVTFDPHPIAVLRPEFTPPILTTPSERSSLLKACGADEVVVLPVTTSLLQMPPVTFFEEIVLNGFLATGIVEGPNFHFGRDRLGNANVLQELCRQHGLRCRIVTAVDSGSAMISSSRIRELLCARALRQAVELLGHPYRMTGIVKQGAGRGRTIGFPTANLTEIQTLLPAHGVYCGQTQIDGHVYPVAASIGPNPTFGEHREKIECHIAGFAGDLYGQELSVDLLQELRPLQSFDSVDKLIQQIQSDVQTSRQLVTPG
jgi:riboflavin kinase/FMN adenylyltransferase